MSRRDGRGVTTRVAFSVKTLLRKILRNSMRGKAAGNVFQEKSIKKH